MLAAASPEAALTSQSTDKTNMQKKKVDTSKRRGLSSLKICFDTINCILIQLVRFVLYEFLYLLLFCILTKVD